MYHTDIERMVTVSSNANQTVLLTCRFGDLDVAIYNAGAITWDTVKNTPLNRYDLMHSVNVRGAYSMVQEVLPHFLKKKKGKIILVSPPIYNRYSL
jgi:NADP-dependent 3-hydroxy acid dehydrogenase YdfG